MQKSKQTILFSFALVMLFMILSMEVRTQDPFIEIQDPATFKTKMNAASETTNSISSEFVQLKHLSFLEEDVESSGIFYFKKESQLRWEYKVPFYYLIIFSNDTVLIRDERKTNIYDAGSGKMFREINNIMIGLVNGAILESKDFSIKYYENSGIYKLELIPLEVNLREFLDEIHLFINKDDYSVDELYMIEKSEDFTRIRFINKQLNEDIPQHIFSLH